jgi:predicted Rossmann-fold nucleotide-binding protein
MMEAANRGTFDVGAKSVGLNISLPHEQYPNPYVAPELCFRFHYFALRKLHFLLRARHWSRSRAVTARWTNCSRC